MLFSRKLFLLFLSVFFLSCISQNVRISPDFGSIRNDIDTITVFSDALLAINTKNDFYSAKASLFLDSLILEGTTKALTKKGYSVKTVEPFLMGSFMDTFLTVPLKPLDSNKIDSTILPYVFSNKLTENQINAVKSISRKAYAAVSFFKYTGESYLPASTSTKFDLKTISDFTNSNYALFIFHQAALVNQVAMEMLALGQIVLTGVLSSGTHFGYITKVSFFHTYVILIELSTGKIIWSNYHNFRAYPDDMSLFESAKNSSQPFSSPECNDSISEVTLQDWASHCFYRFPQLASSRYFKGYTTGSRYPSQNLFFRPPSYKFHDISIKKKTKIDSLVYLLSFSEEVPKWTRQDTVYNTLNEKIPLHKFENATDSLDKYFKLAYSDRLFFKPDLKGIMKLEFLSFPNGRNLNVKLVESTLNDPVMEYAIPYILRTTKLPDAYYRSKAYNMVHEITFGKVKKF